MIKIRTEKLTVTCDGKPALKALDISVNKNEILGVIGPANSGKTTFLRSLNRLNDLNPRFRHEGKVFIDDQEIHDRSTDVNRLRQRVGMVFALPMPLPVSIYENVVYGVRRQGVRDKKVMDGIVESTLKASYLWDEVKDRLSLPGTSLSGGQQQRLCISRALAVDPEVILFDEPCSGLDPISTAKVEEAMVRLKEKYTIVLVTNQTKQAARVSDRVAFFLMGDLIELDSTEIMFTRPSDPRTEGYISGKFG